MADLNHRPADWHAREQALDIRRSWIVQAPAGSGKTELLVQRILALLAVAETPEEVLAITFTRKAAAEMKARVLQALERAGSEQPPAQPHAVDTWRRARSVLARDEDKGWRLLQNPSRLQMLTIDSFCSLLTRRMPWLARFGDQPRVTDEPEELYAQAAEALLSRLETDEAEAASIAVLLAHLDNRFMLLRDLLVAMLGRRDQWLRHLMAQRERPAREILESGLRRYIAARIDKAHAIVGDDLYRRLLAAGRYAAGNLAVDDDRHPFAAFADAAEVPGSLAQWQALAHLVLTSGGDVRKSLNKNIGFPADRTDAAVTAKAETMELLDALRANPDAVDVFRAIRRLPEAAYADSQWRVLRALIELLPLAVVELQDIFRQQGEVDFIEIAGAAHAALGSNTNPEELLLQLDSTIRHILVDEFQDTSYAQYDLLRRLTSGWQPGDGRTLFLVGDPMQSIYRFREADVGLFLRVSQHGLDHLPIGTLVLDTNFRSGSSLVDWVNDQLHDLFPTREDEITGAVPFSRSVAYHTDTPAVVSLFGFDERQDAAEAKQVVELIHASRQADPDGTIAVLVRSRRHLQSIIQALQQTGLRYQAQDIDPLTDRPAIRDILSLVRALHHPADRVAWLAILRAPWCGLTLADLDTLCRRDLRKTVWELLTQPVDQVEMFDRLSDDGRQRLARIVPILGKALDRRDRLSLRRLVESTWLSLGGPACVSDADMKDVQQVMALLDDYANPLESDKLEKRLSQLFAAPDPGAGPELQLMTIHKAKGLEFDTVILPGLGRSVRSQEKTLLRWLEHPDYELLLAPIPAYADEQTEPTYAFLGHVLKEKDDLETLRLLYVALTRAKSRLHLLGHANSDRDGQLKPAAGSLLAKIWPRIADAFAAHVMRDEPIAETEPAPLSLRRLATGWHPPRMPAPLETPKGLARLASDAAHFEAEPQPTLRTEEGRIVGTLVHGWLERIAVEGLDVWTPERAAALTDRIQKQLNAQGVPGDRLAECARLVQDGLSRTLASKRGQWLLTNHPGSTCELALNGVVDGQVVRAMIDRTFVCDGIRWVVDYKTSRPGAQESRTDFLNREAERYRYQLDAYAALIGMMHPDQPIRSALYFPMFDGWIVAEN